MSLLLAEPELDGTDDGGAPTAPCLLVGAPMRGRTWILERWFTAIEDACGQAGVLARYVIAVDPTDPAYTIVERWAGLTDVHVVMLEEKPLPAGDERAWNKTERLAHMVEVRNEILGVVRSRRPTMFWSVDSDILVAPDTLRSAIETLAEGYDAAASLTWMTSTDTRWPNCGAWDPSNGGLRRMRVEKGARYPAQVIMAVKLMAPPAYGVDYRLVPGTTGLGEDIGWSLACGERALRLAIDAHAPCKHVMGPDMLNRIDPRLGW